MNRYKRKALRKYILIRNATVNSLRLIILPGFFRVPLYDVLVFFIKGIFKGSISTRAEATAFNFFLALFPFVIFLFTLIPYIPISNFQETLMSLFEDFIPADTYGMVESTITDIVLRQNTGLLSLSFVLTFIFATNGVSAIMDGFNKSWHSIETKNWWQQRLTAVFLTVTLSVFVIVAIGLITMGGTIIAWLLNLDLVRGDFKLILLMVMKWIIVVLITFLSISLLYYYAPARRRQYRFFSPGSILATALLIIGTLAFNYYIVNFSRYNALYGSIGTLMVFLMWIYFNALILLIGFELNASIKQAHNDNGTIIN